MLPSILPLPDGLRLLPIPAQEHAEALADDRHVLPSPDPSDGTGAPPCRAGSPRWADVMRRTFGLDVLACPRCGGRLRLIALIDEASVIQRIRGIWACPPRSPSPAPRVRHRSRSRPSASGGQRPRRLRPLLIGACGVGPPEVRPRVGRVGRFPLTRPPPLP